MSKLPHNLTMRCGTSGPHRGCVCGSCTVVACLTPFPLPSLSLFSLLPFCFLLLLSPYPLHLGRKCKPFSVFTFNQAAGEGEQRERERSLTGSGSLPAHVQVPSDQLHWLYRLYRLSRVPCPMSMSWTLPVNWRISLSFFAAFYR